ncbi:MAG: IS21 family transposase [Deltaproteobacteria bacterium]|nr:IS21 family transposase [Myxococcales bacterium]MDP3219786.1 IS21 family transposase [Deltaproteobacteria bacterium]
MIPAETRTRVRALFFGEHWKVGTIAAELGLHRDTVARAIDTERMINAHTHLCRSRLDPFKPFVAETLEAHPRLRATRLLEMLRGRGYEGSVGILRAHVRSVRKVSRHEAFFRLTTLPGEQAQIDWGCFGTLRVGHARRPLSCFVMTLSHSRGVFARFYLDQRLESFLDGHVRAFEAFGGAPRKLLYDNLKSVVLERVGDHVRFHPRLLELAGHYHLVPQPCAPYRGNEKGKVERTIRYLRDSFFAARSYRDLDHLNAQLTDWITGIADARKVPGDPSGTLVRDARAAERERLLPLPEHPFPTDAVRAIASGKTPYLRFDKNDYSIPHTLVGRPLTLVASTTSVRVLDGPTEVARHVRSWDEGQRIETPAHLHALGVMKRGAHELRGRDRLRASCPSAESFFETLASRGQALARPSVRLGQLLDHHGAQALERALAEALARGSVSVESVEHVLTQRARETHRAPRVAIPLPDRADVRGLSVTPHALGPYDQLAHRGAATGERSEGGDE